MKKIYLPVFLSLFLIGKFANAQTDGDYRTRASGNWNSSSTWQVRSGGTWSNASTTPGSGNNVYLQYGHKVTLTANAACKDFNIMSDEISNNTRLKLSSYTLSVYGKLRAFSQPSASTGSSDANIPGTSSSSLNGGDDWIMSTTGKISIAGTARTLTQATEWNNDNSGVSNPYGFDIEINLTNTTDVVTSNAPLRARSFTITNGVLDVTTNCLAPDNGNSTGSDITIAATGKLRSAATGYDDYAVISQQSGNIGGAFTLNGTMELTGALPTVGMTSVNLSGGTVIYSASGVQTLLSSTNSGANPNVYNNLTLSGSGVKTLALNTTINGQLSIIGSATLAAGGYGTTSGGSMTIQYNGTSAQTTSDAEFPSTGGPQNIIINNPGGVTLHANRTITGTLTLTSGKFTVPAGNTLTISSGSAVGGSGFGVSKHIVTQVNNSTGAKGMVRLSNFTGTTTLPIGNGTYYMPVTLTASGTNDFSLAVFQGATTNGTPNGTSFTTNQKKNIVDAIWVVNRNGGSGGVTMQISWPSALEGPQFTPLANNQIGISHYNSTYWEPAIGTGDNVGKTVTRSAITNFSPFGVGVNGQPLPVKFGDIKVYQKNSGIQVDWTSFSEVNVDHYEIERSQDGQQFSIAGQVIAMANNASKVSYSWLDSAPVNGAVFYRIKSVDLDGRFSYSTIVKINLNQKGTELIIYPNPVVDKKVSFQTGTINRGQYNIAVYDLKGNTIYTSTFIHQGGVISQVIQLPPSIMPGIYNMNVNGQDINTFKQFVVK